MKRFIFVFVVLGFLAAAFLPNGDLKAAEAATAARPQVLPPAQGIQKPIPGPTEKPSSALVVPLTINYQGRLTNAAGAPIIVPTIMEFRIYDGPGGGATLLWGPQITPVSPDGEGYYSTSLGTGPPFPPNLFDGIPRWVGVTVPPDPEMLPRQEIQSVAYAINADRLGGLTSGDYVKIAGDQMTGELGVNSGGPYGGVDFSFGLFNGATTFFNFSGGDGRVAVDGALAGSRFTAADVYGGAANASPNSIASAGYSQSGSASSTGLYGFAGGSSINRAVHGEAGGGTENWSGYFTGAPVRVGAGGLGGVDVATGAGDLYVANNLEVDGSVTLPAAAVPAAGTVSLSGSTASATAATLDQFTVTAPGPGYFLLNVSGQWWYDADATTTSSITNFFSMGLCDAPASDATCGGTYDFYWYQDADNASGFNSTHGFSITRVVPVGGAGTYTYYLNADNGGTGYTLNLFQDPVASALFIPATLPVVSPKPVAPEVPRRNQ